MTVDFHWDSKYFEFLLGISSTTIGFILYFFLSHSTQLQNSLRKNYGQDKGDNYTIIAQRLTGFLFLGLVPLFIAISCLPFSLNHYGIALKNFQQTFYWTTGIAALIIPINFIMAKKPKNLQIYPQIRAKIWNLNLLIMNTLSWALYLLAYEFTFRGILLWTCARTLSIWPAIMVNTAMYTLAHLPKGAKETLGAIPFGIVLCCITFSTGTIWVAFFVHVVLALSNDYIALHAQPAMKFRLN